MPRSVRPVSGGGASEDEQSYPSQRPLGAAALGAALILVGLAFDLPALLVPGFALFALLLFLGAWVELAYRVASVHRGRVPARVREDEEFEVELGVDSPVPLPAGRLSDPMLDEALPVTLSRSSAVGSSLRFARRGPRPVGPTELTVTDPLGFFARRRILPAVGELLVLPRSYAVDLPPLEGSGRGGFAGGILDEAASSGHEARAVEFEIDGLRSYRVGTPASRIHWPSVARGGEMVERRLVAGADPLPLVVLDASAPVSEEALDAAVRAAASLCIELGARRGCGVLLPGERRPTELDSRLGRFSEVHGRLAHVRSGVGLRGSRMLGRGRAVVWVSGGRRDAAERALQLSGAERGWVVCPGRSSGTGFAVGECWAVPFGRSRAGSPR